jgi:hypothetical protein
MAASELAKLPGGAHLKVALALQLLQVELTPVGLFPAGGGHRRNYR